jgi:hypothetical protein
LVGPGFGEDGDAEQEEGSELGGAGAGGGEVEEDAPAAADRVLVHDGRGDLALADGEAPAHPAARHASTFSNAEEKPGGPAWAMLADAVA